MVACRKFVKKKNTLTLWYGNIAKHGIIDLAVTKKHRLRQLSQFITSSTKTLQINNAGKLYPSFLIKKVMCTVIILFIINCMTKVHILYNYINNKSTCNS